MTASGIGRLGKLVDGIEMLGRQQRLGALERPQQTLRAHRLEQVVQRIDFKGLDCKLVESGHEDHQRHRPRIIVVGVGGSCRHMPGQLDPCHAGHLHIH